jgi:hypothetical protein
MPGLVNAHTHLYQVLLRAVWEDLPLLPWLKWIYGTAQVLCPEHFYAGTILGCVDSGAQFDLRSLRSYFRTRDSDSQGAWHIGFP